MQPGTKSISQPKKKSRVSNEGAFKSGKSPIKYSAHLFAKTAALRPSVIGAGSGASDCEHCEDRSANRDTERNCNSSHHGSRYFGTCETSYGTPSRTAKESGYLLEASLSTDLVIAHRAGFLNRIQSNASVDGDAQIT